MNPDFGQLIDENKGTIQKVCRVYTDSREDFLDVYQEVCLQLWKSHESFRGDSSLSTWIYRVAINTCIGQLRKRKKEPNHHSLQPHHDIRQEDDNERREKLDQLYGAIRSLKETDRALILLYLEDKSYKEITEILGMTMSNVGVRINRIKGQLKEMINGK